MNHGPLRDLALRTPRLELRPDGDAGLAELVEVADAGVHPPEKMPFVHPWTDADPRYPARADPTRTVRPHAHRRRYAWG